MDESLSQAELQARYHYLLHLGRQVLQAHPSRAAVQDRVDEAREALLSRTGEPVQLEWEEFSLSGVRMPAYQRHPRYLGIHPALDRAESLCLQLAYEAANGPQGASPFHPDHEIAPANIQPQQVADLENALETLRQSVERWHNLLLDFEGALGQVPDAQTLRDHGLSAGV